MIFYKKPFFYAARYNCQWRYFDACRPSAGYAAGRGICVSGI